MKIADLSKQLVTIYDRSKTYDGYTVYSAYGSGDIWLINMDGKFVHHWQTERTVMLYGKLLSNGNLLVGSKIPNGPVSDLGGSGGELLELDWNGQVVWRYEDPFIDCHDYDRLKNGNTLISRFAPIPAEIAHKVKGGRQGTEREGTMWNNCLQEITPDGKVEWEWIPHEHLDFDRDTLCPLCPRINWGNANAWSVLDDGNILISLRNINTIAIINKKTGGFEWVWGREELGHQHNPTMLHNGNILVFDNGMHRGSAAIDFCYSRVLEVNPVSSKIEWEYKDKNPVSFDSSFLAGAQRLPNGNTLVCDSTQGRLFEVTSEKEVVWEFFNPFFNYHRAERFGFQNMVYRAYRYGPNFEGLKGKLLDPSRFEWAVQEKGRPGGISLYPIDMKEKIVEDRLKRLGY